MIYGIHRDLIGIYLGDSPKNHKQAFEGIIKRAINLIDIPPESASILNEKRYDVEGMLLSIFPEYLISGEDENGEPTYFEPEEETPISFAKKLYLNINNMELGSSDSFSWPQYFGLLALMEIDNYILQNEYFLEEMESPTEWPDWEEHLINGRINTLISSCEAVCFGETLLEANTPTDGMVRDKISKQAQQAVLKRHKPLRDQKSAFIKFFLDAKDKTNKSALARKFYRSLPEESQKIICHTQEVHKAVRTLVTHLNTVINKKNSPHTFL